MDTTIFLAQIWGPVLMAVGAGFFVSRSRYLAIYRDLGKETFAILVFGILGMTAGIAHILAHNVWESFPQIVVSLLGWGLFLKGAVNTVSPGFAARGAHWAESTHMIPAAGGIALLLGVYLSWVGYLV